MYPDNSANPPGIDFDDATIADLQRRLRRIEGQVRGLQQMLTERRDCRDVVTQIAAANKALEQVGFVLVAAGLRWCLEDPRRSAAIGYDIGEVQKMFPSSRDARRNLLRPQCNEETLVTPTSLTAATFRPAVDGDGIALVDWWASWCGPCRAFGPIFEAAALRHDDIVFAKVDTEANPDLATSGGITSIPTLMAFRDGILLYSQAGALPATALDDPTQIRALDMEDVRPNDVECGPLMRMCRAVTCQTCHRPTWAGCGAHIEHVLQRVPHDQRCQCVAARRRPQLRPCARG